MTTQLIKKEKINWVKDVKFTEKRAPYKKYSKASWNWSEIFCEIEALKESHSKIFKIISEKYNINYGTLKNKYYKFKNNEKNPPAGGKLFANFLTSGFVYPPTGNKTLLNCF